MKRQRKANQKKCEGFSSISPFVDRKVFEYSINLLESSYLKRKTEEVLDYLKELFGEDVFRSIFNENSRNKSFEGWEGFDSEESEFSLDYSDLKKLFGKNTIIKIIQNEFLPILEREFQKRNRPTATDRKLNQLKEVFRLNDIEVKIVSLYYVFESCPIFLNAFNSQHDIDDFTEKLPFLSNSWQILKTKRGEIKRSISKGNLGKTQIIDFESSCPSLSDWAEEFLTGLKRDLNSTFFTTFNDSSLPMDNHLIDPLDRTILEEFIKRKSPANILFFGDAGTGKTALAQSLANHHQQNLKIINIKENDDIRNLKTALIATCNIVHRHGSIILVDEADDLLNTQFSHFFSGERNGKQWINQFLDHCRHKVIWITNNSQYIEPSTMRRFDFSIQFKKFNLQKKLKVFRYCLQQKGLKDFFDEDELVRLCSRFAINAGGIANALKNLKIRKNSRKETVLERLETILRNHHTAITGKECRKNQMKELGEYNLKVLNTSENLEQIIFVVGRFMKPSLKIKGWEKTNLNFLLYGLPGTGKTEFVKFLAKSLRTEVVLKRASDLISCWVGETEKLIAEVFEEAEGNHSILFLDEADSFFYPRDQTRAP
ncbi:MAG: AAA family ATPase, partial [Nitrospinales bacterium]